MRVLIAEDDRITRRMLERQIAEWGHDTISVENGRQAWERFCQDNFSIVVSDWMMPEMDGLELVRHIRKAPRAGYVYVILLTANTEKGDLVKWMEAGADDFLIKPFDPNELRVRLRAGERIMELERSLAEKNADLEAVNQRMSRDLKAAAAVQQSLLPTAHLDVPGITVAWRFRPCDELAGDVLNVFRLDEKHVAVYVADVSGHGVVASLLSVTISRVLTPQPSGSSILVRTEPGSSAVHIQSPAEVAKELNRRFQMDDSRGSYFSVAYGVLNLDSLQFRYVSAGHPAMIRQRGESISALHSEGYAIGWDVDVEYDEHIVELSPGDRLWIYSDGLPEAMNSNLESFGEQRLNQSVQKHRDQDLQGSVNLIVQDVENWCHPAGPKDDVSLLAMEIDKEM